MIYLLLFYLTIASIVFSMLTTMSNNKLSVMFYHACLWGIWFPIYSGGVLASITHAYIHNFSFNYSMMQIFNNNKVLKYIDRALMDVEDLD